MFIRYVQHWPFGHHIVKFCRYELNVCSLQRLHTVHRLQYSQYNGCLSYSCIQLDQLMNHLLWIIPNRSLCIRCIVYRVVCCLCCVFNFIFIYPSPTCVCVYQVKPIIISRQLRLLSSSTSRSYLWKMNEAEKKKRRNIHIDSVRLIGNHIVTERPNLFGRVTKYSIFFPSFLVSIRKSEKYSAHMNLTNFKIDKVLWWNGELLVRQPCFSLTPLILTYVPISCLSCLLLMQFDMNSDTKMRSSERVFSFDDWSKSIWQDTLMHCRVPHIHPCWVCRCVVIVFNSIIFISHFLIRWIINARSVQLKKKGI